MFVHLVAVLIAPFVQNLMILMLKRYIGIIFLLVSTLGWSQQDPYFSHYMFMGSYYNPGIAGLEGKSRATLVHQSTWLGYQPTYEEDGGAPHTQVLTGDHPLSLFGSNATNSGASLVVTNDIIGPMVNLQAKVGFSYHINLSTGGVLGIGLRAGAYSYRIRPRYRAIDEEELLTNSDVNKQIRPDMDFGLWYNTSKYYGGISITHVVPFDFDFDVPGINTSLTQHLYINGGYNIDLSGSLVLTPTLIVFSDIVQTQYDFGLTASLNNYKYWAGVNFKQYFTTEPVNQSGLQWITEGMSFKIGTTTLKDDVLRVGYAFNWVMSGVSAKNPTSHELFLSYILPITKDVGYQNSGSPRFRHDD